MQVFNSFQEVFAANAVKGSQSVMSVFNASGTWTGGERNVSGEATHEYHVKHGIDGLTSLLGWIDSRSYFSGKGMNQKIAREYTVVFPLADPTGDSTGDSYKTEKLRKGTSFDKAQQIIGQNVDAFLESKGV